jgi:hypothetical protein
MALIGFEGFDHFPTGDIDSDLILKPFSTGLGGITGGIWTKLSYRGTKVAGLLGGYAYQTTSDQAAPKCSLGANYVTGINGFRFMTPSVRTAIYDFFTWIDASTIQCGVSINTSGNLIFWRGTHSTILATSTAVLSTASWYFLEFKVTIDGSTGAITTQINGVNDAGLTASGLNTKNSANAYFNAFQFVNPSVVLYTYDDVYMVDTTGSPPYNTFLGIIRVETLYPTAANATAWTPNSSTNVSRIQETANDGDTTYNSIAATGQDTFTHGALSSTPSTIFAVAITASMRKDDVGAQTSQTTLISNGTTQQGAAQNTPTAYAYHRDVYLNDPHTSAAWLAAAVNATDIGYNHV